jgi:glucose-1-phosphate thymidylyltransferase
MASNFPNRRPNLKGVILAGGSGSRLFPLTKITNKHLLPVYKEPMIYYPLKTLVNAGITEILIVTGGRNAGDFLRLLSNGKEFGLRHVNYAYQEGEGGIADALRLAEYFAGDERISWVTTSSKETSLTLQSVSRPSP